MTQPYFTQIASQWDSLRATMFTEAVRTAALERAALYPEATVADIGAGTGFISQGLAPLAAKVHLVDNSAEMLAVARQNLADFDNVEFHLADGTHIPLPDGSVDALFANMYLHHTENPQLAIAEMARVLKPGGRLVITDLDEHTHTWLHEEQDDIWLGFRRDELFSWYEQAGLVNLQVEDTSQSCCAKSETEDDQAAVSIFVAVGTKPRPEMQQAVAERYRQIALSGGDCGCSSSAPTPVESGSILLEVIQVEASSCCNSSASCCDPAAGDASLGASEASEATISLGCGNPLVLASLKPGEVVLDIGSGAGADVFPAAQRVGPQGKVIGLDMLEEMLERARETARAHHYTNVEFRLGEAQNIPLDDDSVDVVMSNCVINLVQDKGLAFRESFRVLKPGGRLSISDIVTDRPFSPALQADAQAWSACVSGAISEREYLALVARAGFKDIKTVRSEAWPAEDGTQVYSLNISAIK